MNLFLAILASAILVDNFVLSKFLGICSYLGVSNRLKTALGMSYAVIFVMVMSAAVVWPIREYLLVPFGLTYLTTLVYILVIAALVQLVEAIMRRYMTPLYNALGIYLPLITTNCAVLAVVLLSIEKSYGFFASVLNGLGGGLGYMLAIVIFAGVRERIEANDFPENLKGLPIILIASSIVSLSFLGFAGIVEKLFG